ncbi:hypothetical protein, partial [Stenotrophomonas sp. SrG]|uniref:hypothetical protein n=1 Tax=Stenotrophomonas sp. SrG TaxID=3414430 RepID=UPI003CEED2CC
RIGLGEVEDAVAEYHHPYGSSGRHALSTNARSRATDLDLALLPRGSLAQYRYSQWRGGLRGAWSPPPAWDRAGCRERGPER